MGSPFERRPRDERSAVIAALVAVRQRCDLAELEFGELDREAHAAYLEIKFRATQQPTQPRRPRRSR